MLKTPNAVTPDPPKKTADRKPYLTPSAEIIYVAAEDILDSFDRIEEDNDDIAFYIW